MVEGKGGKACQLSRPCFMNNKKKPCVPIVTNVDVIDPERFLVDGTGFPRLDEYTVHLAATMSVRCVITFVGSWGKKRFCFRYTYRNARVPFIPSA